MIPEVGDKVAVEDSIRKYSECEYVDRIAGRFGHVVQVDVSANEAFVVANVDDSDGTYVPLEFLSAP